MRRRLPNTQVSRRRERTSQVIATDSNIEEPTRRVRRNRPVATSGQVISYRQQSPVTRAIWRGPVEREFRHGDHLHVSDLVHTCIRKMALSEHLNIPMPRQEIWDGQGITFKIGEAIGKFIVGKMLEVEDAVHGMWACKCEEPDLIGPCTLAEVQTRGEANLICDRCNAPYINYREMSVNYAPWGLVGNIDMCLMYDALLIIEIKSMARTSWDRLTHPIPDHLVQVLLYWWMARELGLKLYDSVSIIYVCKEWKFGNPYKEYVINTLENLSQIDAYLEEAQVYHEFKHEDGPLPPRNMCDSPDATLAKKCEFCNACFEND